MGNFEDTILETLYDSKRSLQEKAIMQMFIMSADDEGESTLSANEIKNLTRDNDVIVRQVIALLERYNQISTQFIRASDRKTVRKISCMVPACAKENTKIARETTPKQIHISKEYPFALRFYSLQKKHEKEFRCFIDKNEREAMGNPKYVEIIYERDKKQIVMTPVQTIGESTYAVKYPRDEGKGLIEYGEDLVTPLMEGNYLEADTAKSFGGRIDVSTKAITFDVTSKMTGRGRGKKIGIRPILKVV